VGSEVMPCPTNNGNVSLNHSRYYRHPQEISKDLLKFLNGIKY
jgi:hypothetical protein